MSEPRELSVQPTPYYSDDAVTIYHGDCRDIAPDLKADVVVTDPPYGIDYNPERSRKTPRRHGAAIFAQDWNRVVGDADTFDPEWLLALKRPTTLWGANHYSDRLTVGGWAVWVKGRPEGFAASDAEMAWSNDFAGVKAIDHLWSGFRRASEVNEHYHPTQKPLVVMRWLLGFVSEGVVLDPYMGSGSTLRAAKDLGRRAVGIEIEERYCEIAAQRCAQDVLFGEVA